MLLLTLLSLGSTLHDAVKKNNATLLLELVSNDTSKLEVLDDNSLTPLHLSAYHGHLQVAVALLEAGAPLDTQAHGGMTALHWAVGQGHAEVAIALLGKGAGRGIVDNGGHTALHFAASRGHDDILPALLQSLSPPELVDATSGLGVTALQMAAEKGQASCVALLLKAGADKSKAEDENKISALHGAAAMGHVAAVRALIAAKAPLEQTDAQQRTPLHLAAVMGQAEAVEVLLATGAAVEARDAEGKTPRWLAERARRKLVVAALRRAGAEPSSAVTRLWRRARRWCSARVQKPRKK